MSKKFIYTVIATLFLIGGILGYNYYQKIFGKSISKETVLFVHATDTLIDIKDKNILQIIHAFIFAVIMYFGSMYIFGPLLGEGIVNVPSPPSGASASIDGLAASQLCRDCRNNQQTKIEIAHENGTLSNLLSSDEYQQMADGCAAKCRDYQQIG